MTAAAPRIAIIVAIADNGVIGADGDMPWKVSADLKRFRRLTMGKPVVMGRKTLQSIGKPLDGRDNIVLTRDPNFAAEGILIARDLASALELARGIAVGRGVDEVLVIGGGILYAEALPLADRLYVTHIAASPAGDTRFPAIDPAVWRPVDEEPLPRGPKDTADARAVTYERIAPTA
ncbi:dihydrofolate reductase [Chthonobacter albigriseus]|uniref:dihydrofolate reductase n=1 Tax=Chthonobacter albigriseus TaxID=1683161 RepID=UPI0015EEFC7E